jgi:hypothetical protein|tara:strand:+ start:1715 stop:2416 length:702 start_codon:yes stop_codon:yes gene_type:complete
MKFSNEIKDVLSNFQTINSNIALGEEGGMIRSMSTSKTLMAKANVQPEAPYEWPYAFGIYDLGEFLACLNMFEDPTLNFDEDKKFVTITDGITQFKYFFSDIDILTVPTKDIDLPCADIQFTLTLDQLNQLRKASATLKTNQLSIRKNDSAAFIECVIVDKQNPTSNQFSMNVSNCSINTSADFDLVLDMNNFKFVNADSYEFGIDKKLIASVMAGNTQYWVALDKTTTYKEI